MTLGSPALNIAIFAAFVAVTLFIVIRITARQAKTGSAFYTGNASFSGSQNGLAIAGDYLSAASILGIAGAIAFTGYDGMLYMIGFLVAWLVALLLVAEPLRNTGKFTMADVLSFRMRQRPVRLAASISTLVVSVLYLLAQMAAAGGLVSLLLGVSTEFAQNLIIVVVGVLMIVYVVIGGMKGTTWVQMIKAVLLIGATIVMAVWVMVLFRFDLGALMARAVEANSAPDLLSPGNRYSDPIGFLSLAIALVLGASGLPHVLMRFYTVPTAKQARKSVTWAIGLIGAFYLCMLFLGYGAAAIVPGGIAAIAQMPGASNAAAPALSFFLPGGGTVGTIFLAVIAAVAFATTLAVVAGLAITAAASFAHDIYNSVIKRGRAEQRLEVRVAKIAVLVLGVLTIIGGIYAKSMNIAFLVALAFAVAASANLPSILYSLYWRRFNTSGSLWSISVGLGSSLVLIVFSPAVSTPIWATAPLESAMFPGASFAWFPYDNPAIVSVPLAFLAGWLGTVLSSTPVDAAKTTEMEVRSLTGLGAEGAVSH